MLLLFSSLSAHQWSLISILPCLDFPLFHQSFSLRNLPFDFALHLQHYSTYSLLCIKIRHLECSWHLKKQIYLDSLDSYSHDQKNTRNPNHFLLLPFYSEVSHAMYIWKFIFTSCHRISSPSLWSRSDAHLYESLCVCMCSIISPPSRHVKWWN